MAVGTLTIGPNVDVDFLLITNGQPAENVADLNYEPMWDEHSEFLAKFDNTLRTGNLLQDGTPPTSWAVYRQKVGSEAMEYIITVEGQKVVCYDYMPQNYATYFYHSFARTESDMSEDITSKPITPSWPGWVLITLDESAEDGRYIPHEIFIFQYNLELGDMSNNTAFNRLETFTPYPFIQRSSANYMSGQLKGLLGSVNCTTGEFYDTVKQADAVRALTTDTRRKILKDLQGHVFEVELASSILFSILPNIEREPYSATVQWTEIADSKQLRVVATEDEFDQSSSIQAQGEYTAELYAHRHKIADVTGLTERLDELALMIEESKHELPTATDDTLGGVIVGDGLDVDADGVVTIREVKTSELTQDEDIVIDLGGAED